LLGGVLLPAGAALVGFTQPVSLLGFAVIGLAGATTLLELAEYIWDAVKHSRQKGEFVLEALWGLFGRNRRRYGGYLVHAGVILMALGVVGTRIYPFEAELVLPLAQPTAVQDYVLVLEDMQQEPGEDYLSTQAVLSVYRGSTYLATLRPQMDQYAYSDQTVGVPALRTSLREDLYIVLAGWGSRGETATLKVFVNPLGSFLWLGSLVFLAGGAVALWPRPRTVRLPVPEARRRRIATIVGLAIGVLVLVAAGVAMWGGVRSQSRGRPIAGQVAPNFELDLLDGSALTLSDLRGQVVVVNFWATWCPPCEEELPDLQMIWEEYRADGSVVIGVAFQEEAAAVQEIAAQFGVTYPLGLDVGERISEVYGITAVPETFVVDQEGRVAYVHIGSVTAERLRAELDALLAGR
jgi:peroxiredoxin